MTTPLLRDSTATPARRLGRWAALLAVVCVLGALPASAQPVSAPSVGTQPEPLALADSTTEPLAETADEARQSVVETPQEARDSLWTALMRSAEGLAMDTTEENVRKRPLPLTVFGYYRLLLYGRNMTESYPNLAPFERAYGVGDGYREPMLSITVAGRPSGRASFGTELFAFAPYEGTEEQQSVISLNLGINFYGNFRTEAGNYGVRAGGIHWYNLSPFTIGVDQALERYSIFDRTPWEGVDGAAKYDNYFLTGQANPGDERFNFQAFQGLILNGQALPGDIGFDAFWGKTQPNGGLPGATTDPSQTVANEGEAGDTPTYINFGGEAEALPSFITGGRLQRAFGTSLVSLNSIYSYRTLDSLSADRRQYQVHTGSFDANVAGVNVSGELGASLYESPTYTSKWGEALMVRAKTGTETTGLPLDLQVYKIGRHFFNENSAINTGNNPQINADAGSICSVGSGGTGAGAPITQVNQLAHNRRGVNFNTEWSGGPAAFGVGWGMAHELAPTTTQLSYVHRINGLATSRIYNPFPENAVCATTFGSLNRQVSVFRSTIELARTTDVDPVTGIALNRKYFHAVDLQGKARARVLDRPLYLFYLGSFGSANQTATVLPKDDDTYIFVQYHEVDLYYELVPGFLFTGYLGLENAQGGRFTEISETSGLPRDQHGRAVGVGFDWTLARNAGLYLRHRWMDFEDRSFALETYTGTETTLELKMFF